MGVWAKRMKENRRKKAGGVGRRRAVNGRGRMTDNEEEEGEINQWAEWWWAQWQIGNQMAGGRNSGVWHE